MARYIDLDKYLEDNFCDEYDECVSTEDCFICWARRHTEDVAPSIHAKWKLLENDYVYDNIFTYKCSNCLNKLCITPDNLMPYCPHCGAKMDKG